jgi:quinol monooxygenase YgiN
MKYIFEVHIKPGCIAEQYAELWLKASELIQRSPGAGGTRLHRMIGNPNVLIAIAEWDSKAARDASQGRDPRVGEIIRAAANYCEVRIIGEFDEPEWVILPDRAADSG